MKFPIHKPARRNRRAIYASSIALAVTAAMLGPMPAVAAPGDIAFSSSFEIGDDTPTLTGTGEAVNISGDRFRPGSLLDRVVSIEASAENDPNEVAVNLADGSPATKWLAFQSTGWVTYELDAPAPIAQYTLTSANDAAERDPKDFTIEGSDNGTDWTVVDTQTDVEFSDRHQTLTFTLDEPSSPYLHYRLDITGLAGDVNLVQLADWELIETLDAEATPSDLFLEVNNGPTFSYTAKTNVGWTGVQALGYSGRHLDSGPASSTSVLYEEVDIDIVDGSQLSYMVFPVLDGEQTYAATFVAVDLVFDDGTTLSASDATDTYGYPANARAQGYANKLWPDQWNKVTIDLSQFNGRTVEDILFTYDHPGSDVQNVEPASAETAFRGWIDDIVIDEAVPLDTTDGLVSYVDTRRGTNSTGGFSRGNNIPAAAWPNGFNFLVPMTNADTYGTIYHYQQNNTADNLPALQGIGFSHQPSIWMGDRNQLAVLPADNASPTSTLNERRLTFRHENETARPDIYEVEFENGIATSVTPTDHGAVYRFTFTGDASSVLIDNVTGSANLTISGNTVTGWVDGGSGWPGRTRMFVYGEFDATPTASGNTPRGNRSHSQYAAFDTSADDTIELRIASSFISQDQAQHNYSLELDGRSFEDLHTAVRNAWNDRLSVISGVQGASQNQMITLYSSLYRLNLYPNSQFENVGTADAPRYQYASPVSPTSGSATDTHTNAPIVDGKIYVNNGFWDTYRTAWPLYALLYPELTEELVDGFVQHYRDGGWVSRWSSPGYADLMTGTSSDVAFAEAYLAGALDTELALDAYDAALKNATVLPTSSAVGRKGLAQSIFLGYTQAGTHESASWGLEGFINDFGIANMARALAEDPNTPEERVQQLLEEAEYFEARAQHYVEMYNPEAGVFTARNANGTWPVGSDFDKKAWGGAYTEASGWTFAFHAPHDVAGMAALYGGRQGLVDEIHEFLTEREKADYSGIHEAREARDVRRGMLGISNQVAHHIPYVLAEAGDVQGAQELIRDLQVRMFVGDDIGQGYPGDEDNGEFSAWYVFSALGFYPLEVGSGDYTIGTPLFDSITLNLEGGSLTINAPGAGSQGLTYVAGAAINGTPITETTFDGSLLRAGGTMTFMMSGVPSTWGAKDLSEPLEVPTTLVDATRPDRGTLVATDGTPVGALVDDNMNSSTTFPSGSTELVWTSQSGPVAISQYTLTSAGSSGAPQTWTLSGSVDGSTWTELDSRSGEEFVWSTQTRPFSVAEDGGFTSLKLEIESGDGALALAEVELFASSAGASELSVTPMPTQTVAIDDEFTGALATIVGSETDASGYDVTVDYGDGDTVDDVSLTRDDLGGWRLTAPHSFDAPGVYTAAITVRDSSGATASVSTTVNVVRDYTFEGSFTMVCIGDFGLTAANCDHQGYGYYRDKLADDGFIQGETLPVPGTDLTYDLPAVEPGEPDNITGEGQRVYVELGEGATQISFIGAATESNRNPEATLHFTDGTTQTVQIAFGDWVGASGNPAYGNTVLAVSEGRLSGTGAESPIKNTAIYATAPITLDVDDDGEPKVVEWLTMPTEPGTPRDGRVHVFAIASDGDRSTSALLEVEPLDVESQTPDVTFEADLATVTGDITPQTAIINWGDGTSVSAVDVTDGVVTGEHTYAAAGTYTVTVTVDDTVRSVSTELEIIVEEDDEPGYTPEIELSASEAAPGDTIRVTGSGFAPGEAVQVRIGTGTPVTGQANGDGELDIALTVPADAVDGVYPVIALGAESQVEATAELTVDASTDPGDAVPTSVSLSADPTDLVAGDSVRLTATVSPAEATGHVEFVRNDTVVGTANVNGGTASADVVVATAGTHTFVARFVPADADDFRASTSATISVEVRDVPVLEPEISLDRDSVAQGGTVQITGRGFGANEEVTLTLHSDPVQLTVVDTDAVGAFRVTVEIPAVASVGEHVIEAVGATTGLSASADLTVAAADDDAPGGSDDDDGSDDPGDDIPTTGASLSPVVMIIILSLLVAGGTLLIARRGLATEEE